MSDLSEQAGDEQRWLRLADRTLWDRLYLAPGQREPVDAEFDVLPVVAGSESRHRREASGLVAAYLAWHLERGLKSLAHVDRG